MILFQVLRVRGNSLSPAYRDGDYVIITGLGLKRVRPGDVVVFEHPEYGRMIKRVEGLEACGRLRVRGDDLDSVDSRRFGPIPRAFLTGRVFWHIRRPV